MSHQAIKGFTNTPITKYFTYASIIIPIIVSLLQYKHYFYLAYSPYISEWMQYWRFLTFQISCVNESDLLLILVLLYNFKVLERLYGSWKYISLITLTYVYITLLSFGVSTLTSVLPFDLLDCFQSGPIGICMCIFVQYCYYIPSCYKFEIVLSSNMEHKVMLTDKVFMFVVSAFLLFNNGFKSIYHGLIGIFLGELIIAGFLPGLKWRLPFYDKIEKYSTSESSSARAPQSNDDDADESNQEQQIRAETPVRPLGSQFLDTFRT